MTRWEPKPRCTHQHPRDTHLGKIIPTPGFQVSCHARHQPRTQQVRGAPLELQLREITPLLLTQMRCLACALTAREHVASHADPVGKWKREENILSCLWKLDI